MYACAGRKQLCLPSCWTYCSFFFLFGLIVTRQAGLGGARDATNVISSSELDASIITAIGEEHLAALGGSLESIAMAKAGIIKHGRPVR